MPIDFPDFESLKRRAVVRGFRQPCEGETEEQYRLAFSIFMASIDVIESMEIASGLGMDYGKLEESWREWRRLYDPPTET